MCHIIVIVVSMSIYISLEFVHASTKYSFVSREYSMSLYVTSFTSLVQTNRTQQLLVRTLTQCIHSTSQGITLKSQQFMCVEGGEHQK